MPEIRVTELNMDDKEAVIEIAIPNCTESKVNDDNCFIKTFCHPFCYPLSDYAISLFGFGVDNIWIEHTISPPIKTPHGFFSYRLSAKVIDTAKQHVKLGEYDFFLDTPLPKDICNGAIVSFDVLRIDISLE